MVDPSKARAVRGFLLLALLGSAVPLAAQTVPTGRQEYIVLGYDQHVYEMMRRVAQAEAAPIAGNQMNSVVSFVASADFQRIHYDHWEDGYEADVFNPTPGTTFPAGSTIILGDGIAANGDACAFAVGACTGDTILAGMALNLASNVATGIAPCTAGTEVRCRVPVNPRGTGIRYDGGDAIGTSGGPLSLIHNQDPVSPFIGGATEVLPRQAFANATAYSIPAGEGLYGGNGTVTEPFKYVSINLVAFQDGTQVFINSPTVGAIVGGTVSITLNKGQHYSSCRTWGAAAPFRCTGGATGGAIDGATAPGVTINPGTRISTNGPIGGLLFTGGDGNYATDFFPILPDLLHGTDYMIPSAGDAPGTNGDRPLNLYIFNPDPLNALTVNVTDSAGTVTGISVPASSTIDYITAMGRDVPNSGIGPGPTLSTVRLTAARPFWGLTVHDHQSPANDWGYAWLASAFLTDFYTASYAPGRQDPQLNPPPSCGAPPCDTLNRAPLWIGATQDNTRILIDLDRDGLFDRVDTNSDDLPDSGVADPACDPAPPTNGICLYIVNALQTLRIFDYTDYDNTGTRIFADKPVSVAYGQDTDQAIGGDPIIDTGYTVFPTLQRFLDPVLTVEKAADPATVPTTGGTVTFTATVRSYNFGPLTNLQVWDVLPAGITSCAAYVAGSTVVTYPNLTQTIADPSCNDNGGAGPVRLDWTISPNTIGLIQTLTVRFAVTIPAGPATTLTNTVFSQALLGSSRYQPSGSARVVRTNVAMAKSVQDDGSPAPGEILTYTLNLTNNGGMPETTVTIRDAIPPGTSFVTGSITASAPFAGAYSAAQNSVVWTAASWAAGTSATLTFQVRINAGTAPGTVISNSARYDSAQTPSFPSNVVTTTVVGPILAAVKTRLGTGDLHPLEVETFQIQVSNSGAGPATNVAVADNLAASNAAYVAGTLRISLNAAPFTALTDAADADEGSFAGTTVQFLLASLGPASDVRFRFQARVNAGTAGQNLNNQATVSAAFVPPFSTNLLQVPIVGTAFIAGHVFLDLDTSGADNAEPDAVGVTVIITDLTNGNTFTVLTDANGNYVAAVPPGAQVQAVVQNGTGTIPAGSALTTGNASQTRTAGAAGTTTNNTDVGYDPPPLSITKTSSAGGTILPGQATTYTVTVTNHTGLTQTSVQLVDVVPTNTTYVPGTARVAANAGNAIRVTEVYFDNLAPDQCAEAGTDFAGVTCTITLPALSPNYFVIVQGSDVNNTGGNDTTPDQSYARLSADPFGNFGTTLGANQLRFTRGADLADWRGVITVVECVSPDCAADPNGFQLVDVVEVTHAGATTGPTAVLTGTAWTDLSRVVLFGGANGSGCSTLDTGGLDHETCHPRLFPSGTNSITWTRDGTSGGLEDATSTVMAVQWGSAWTVQRVNVMGPSGGDGLNAAGEYNTAAITPVVRANTWVWGTGHTTDADAGESAEAAIVTLGNGVAQNATESLVAVGTEEPEDNVTVNFDVYTMTHPLLQVDYDFLADGNNGSATVDVATNAQAANRMALVYNGNSDTGNNYPRSIFSARYTTNAQITLERRRTGSDFPAWVQGVGFDAVPARLSVNCLAVYPPAALNCTEPSTNSSVVDPVAGFTIASGQTLVLTYQARVDADVPGGTVITNTAIVDTLQEAPTQASVQDVVLVGGVTVEPNNAGFTVAGTRITFSHDVTNTGAVADSYLLTVTSELPWRIDLVDPDTGAIIATDTTGDGVWDVGGPVLSTGSMAPGAVRSYDVRVTVPAGTPLATQDTVRLNAVSTRSPAIADDAKDEITVISAEAQVVVTPDNSGLFAPGGTTSYAHYVVNRTSAFDTFDLYVASALSWPTTIHADTNGDGIYNPGVDLQVANTALLAPGAAQLIFVVTTDPAPGSAPGTRDVAQITAASRNNPQLFGAATDTTTVVSNEVHDLSGGGTRLVSQNVDAVYPGTILNDQAANDRFELGISAAGLFGQDALPHPTVLRIDTNADGVPDTTIATDLDGNGTWDTVSGAYDQDGDLLPDVPVSAGSTLAYELVRHVDALQVLERDFVTLTSRSVNNPSTDPDSVTATWVFAAVTRAGIRGVRVDRGGLVEFVTGHQKDTASFMLFETDDPRAGFKGLLALHDEPVRSPMPDSVRPILYRVRTRPVTRAYVVIVETETDGDRLRKGPFPVGDAVLAREVEGIETRLDRMGVPPGETRLFRGRQTDEAARSAGADHGASRRRKHLEGEGAAVASGALKIEVEGAGVVRVPAAQLGALGSGARPGRMRLFNLGREVAYQIEADGGSWSLVFQAERLSTDYTARNVYVLTGGAMPFGMQTRLTRTGDGAWPGFRRVERNLLYVPTGPAGADPWVWDYVGVGAWPVVDVDPAAGDFDLPGYVPGAEQVPVRLRLAGQSPHTHTVDAALNGAHVGSVVFDGAGRALLEGFVPANLLLETGNRLTLTYSSAPLPGSSSVEDGFVTIDHLDLGEWPTTPTAPITASAVLPYDGTLPALAGVEYLIVTHPLFRSQAERLAGLKAAEGLATAIVDTETAYDRFSGGVTEAGAVRALVRHAREQTGVLRFVLLLGDDTFDPRDLAGVGPSTFVPSLFVRDQSFGWIPSENPYADTDGDGRPDVAIGRLPAQTPAEADFLVDKVESQSTVLASRAGRHVFVADNAGELDADFPAEAEAGLALVPRGQTTTLVSLGSNVTQARAEIDASWQGGVMLSHYFGHGGFNQWADESLLTNSLVAGSGGAWRAGVVLSWACLAQWYVDIYGRTVNEELLLSPGGAVASFGPSGISAPAGHRVLFERIYAALYAPGATLGEAILVGKRQALEERPTLADVVHGFNLLGDPALRLPSPPSRP